MTSADGGAGGASPGDATRLLDALESLLRNARSGLGSGLGAGTGLGAQVSAGLGELAGLPIATGSAECALCPVCQLLARLRSVRPESVQQVSEALGVLVSALRTAVDQDGRADRPVGPERIPVD